MESWCWFFRNEAGYGMTISLGIIIDGYISLFECNFAFRAGIMA